MHRHERFYMAGVMGHPVFHSRSPMLHNYWLEKYGLTGRYMPLDIHADGIEKGLRALPALGFSGCNLTMPYKETAIHYVDRVSPLVKQIGAMNCVVVTADGELEGHNFDAFGSVESIAQEVPDWRADAGPIVVLGAGGGSRAVVAGLADRGAKEIRVINRSARRAERLVHAIGGPAKALPWESRHEAIADAALVINTTSQGMRGQPPLDLDLRKLPLSAIVCDIVYVPKVTPLIAAARARGNFTVCGVGMLLHQARPAFHAWFGIMPDITGELRAMIEAGL